jgi:WD40 repeat protein
MKHLISSPKSKRIWLSAILSGFSFFGVSQLAQPNHLQAQVITPKVNQSNQTQPSSFETILNNTINLESNSQNIKRKIAFAIDPKTQQQYLAGVQANKTIILWKVAIDSTNQKLSLNSPRVFTEKTKPNEEIGAIAISADCKFLAASFNAENVTKAKESRDNRIIIWDIANGKVAARLYGISNMNDKRNNQAFNYFTYSLIFSPDNQFLISGHRTQKNSPVIIWKLNSVLSKASNKNREVRLNSLIEKSNYYKIDADQGPLESIALSLDNKLLATSGSEKNVKLWDATTWNNTPITTALNLKRSHNGAQTLAFSKDNNQLAAGIATGIEKGRTFGEVYLWDIKNPKTPQPLQEFKRIFNSSAISVNFNDKNNWLLAGSLDGQTKIWNLPNNKEIINKQLNSKMDSAFFAFKFNPKNYFLTTTFDGNISMWEITAIDINTPKAPTPKTPNITPTPIISLIDKPELFSGIFLLFYTPIAMYYIVFYRKKLQEFIIKNSDFPEHINSIIERENQAIINNLNSQQPQKIYLDHQSQLNENIKTLDMEIEYDTQSIVNELNNTNQNLKGIIKQTFEKSILFDKTKNKQILITLDNLSLIMIICHITLLVFGIWLSFSALDKGLPEIRIYSIRRMIIVTKKRDRLPAAAYPFPFL